MKTENLEKIRLLPPKTYKNEEADFETAITASGFGKFNYFLFLIAIPAGWTTVFEVTTMSYVFPAAQCDLHLSLHDKGILNAITFAGMVSTGFIWGFLCDSFGRKKLLAICFFLDAFFVVVSSLSTNVIVIIIAKFFGGMIINGPTAALTSYISEFHGVKYRARIQMLRGLIVSCGSMILPLLAWGILPLKININIMDIFKFHSWNLYLLICALPSFFSGIVFLFMPESPKFLMSTGQNEEALHVLSQVFCFNTGDPAENYPIKRLIMEVKPKEQTTYWESSKAKLRQLKHLFLPPHLANIILVCTIQFLNKASLSPLKLWLPQIFQAINHYHQHHNGSEARLCIMLQELQPANHTLPCSVDVGNSFVYINTMIASLVAILGYILAGSIINIMGEKRLLIILGIVSGLCSMLVYFAESSAFTLIMTSSTTALGSICANTLIAIVVELFPTRLRTTAISLVIMMNKGGSMIGNMLFPLLLQTGCASTFFTIGGAIVGCSLFSLILPKINNRPLK